MIRLSLSGGRPRWFWWWWDNQRHTTRLAILFVAAILSGLVLAPLLDALLQLASGRR